MAGPLLTLHIHMTRKRLIGVPQTDTSEKGDCLAACIATLLGLPDTSTLPNFWDNGTPVRSARQWLISTYNMTLIPASRWVTCRVPVVYVASVKSKRHKDGFHAILVTDSEVGIQFEVYFDPNKGVKSRYNAKTKLEYGKDIFCLYLLAPTEKGLMQMAQERLRSK